MFIWTYRLQGMRPGFNPIIPFIFQVHPTVLVFGF